jgi:hypothetical protein
MDREELCKILQKLDDRHLEGGVPEACYEIEQLAKKQQQVKTGCEHCETLAKLFTEIKSNHEYWLYTEMFVRLHGGADHCEPKKKEIEKTPKVDIVKQLITNAEPEKIDLLCSDCVGYSNCMTMNPTMNNIAGVGCYQSKLAKDLITCPECECNHVEKDGPLCLVTCRTCNNSWPIAGPDFKLH